MGLIIYVKSTDGVVLRFEDIDTLKVWVETGRLERDAVYLSGKEWRPLEELLETTRKDSRTAQESPSKPDVQTPATSEVKQASRYPMAREEVAVPTERAQKLQETDTGASEQRQEMQGGATPRVTIAERTEEKQGGAGTATRLDGENAQVEKTKTRVEDISIERPVPEEKPKPKVDEPIELWASEPDPYEEAEKRRALRKRVFIAIAALACAGIFLVAIWQLVQWKTKPDSAQATWSGSAFSQGAVTQANTDTISGVKAEAREGSGVSTGIVNERPVVDTERHEGFGKEKGVASVDSQKAVQEEAKGESEEGEEEGKGDSVTSARVVTPTTGGKEAKEGSEAGELKGGEMTYDKHMGEGYRYLKINPKRALAHFQMASRLNPSAVEPVAKMGDCALVMGDIDVAMDYYQKALKMSEGYGPAMIGIARGFARKGNKEQARLWYKKYLDTNPRGSQAEEARQFLAGQGQ